MELRQLTLKAHLGWVNIRAYNFFFCGPKFTYFFRPTWKELWLMKYFYDLRYVDQFGYIRDQSRKLSEIAPNYGRFFALPNFKGGSSKSYTHFITPALRHVAWKSFVRIRRLFRVWLLNSTTLIKSILIKV